MVCDRCLAAVRDLLDRNKIAYDQLELGEVSLKAELKKEKKERIEKELKELGFEMIDNRKTQTIEKIKKTILGYISELPETSPLKLSNFISDQLHYEYTYLSNLFSEVEGITIEHFFIRQRIEKVKEFLVYDQLSLSEIAYKLGFSSVHHLSAQFKKETGLTPSHFKKIGASKRKTIDRA